MNHIGTFDPSTVRAILLATIATVGVVVAGSIGSTASAQASSAPTLDAMQPDTLPTAPVGHRQPQRADVPAGAKRGEGAALSSERSFDQQLQICRGC
jgi:hypothetical protein